MISKLLAFLLIVSLATQVGMAQEKIDTSLSSVHVDTLKMVTVKGDRFQIMRRIDKTLIKVEGNKYFDGNTLQEVLEKTPGIIVGADNTIKVNGSGAVGYQINGKDFKVPQNVISNLLRSLQSAAISDIESMGK